MGLMTVGKLDAPPEPYFEQLNNLRAELLKKHPELGSLELSMGMSGDWETAVKMGSTNIRVGTTIFGARVYNCLVCEQTPIQWREKEATDWIAAWSRSASLCEQAAGRRTSISSWPGPGCPRKR